MIFYLRRSAAFFLLSLFLATPCLALAEERGGIEIGAKGIRAIVVDIHEGDKEPSILMVENQNATLVADLAATKRYSPKTLSQTVDIVEKLAQQMRQEFKLPDARLHLVGSSGLFVGLDNPEDIQANKNTLIDAMRKKIGLTMEFVSVEREAELTIVSIIPSAHRDDAILLDIGSGNTKGGAERKGAGLMTFALPFGTISFTDRVKKESDNKPFEATAAGLRDQLLVPQLRKSLAGKEQLVQRKRVYLGGGAVWALTTFVKPLDRGQFVALSPRDFKHFQKFLAEHNGVLPNPDLADATDKIKKVATKDLDKVRQTFSRDQLIAGVEILNALTIAFQLDREDKQIFFARNMYIGWILGYTIEKGTPGR